MSAVLTKLSDKWKQRAKEELGEDEREVDGAIETLRSWAEQEPWLQTPTDSDFLLRYLRVRKFSQLESRTSLGNFWHQRASNPQWFNPDVHPENPAILDMIKTGFYIVAPCEDSQGRLLLIERIASLNMSEIEKKYGTLDVVVQAMMCVQDMLHMDERIQVNGHKVFADTSSASMDTMKLMNPSTLKKLQAVIEKSMPDRMKGFHIYGLPSLFESLLQFARSLMKPKTRDRLFVHSNMVSVYDQIEKHMLPKEYLPDEYIGDSVYTIQDAIDSMVKNITRPEVVAHIKDLNSGKYGVDMKLRETTETPAESFKKLNID